MTPNETPDPTADPRRRLAFALDYPTLDEARRGAEAVRASAGVLKVGLELFVREGPPAVRLGPALGCQVFLDLKLHDIPKTVDRAVGVASGLGVRYLTLHAAGGPHMLEQAAKRADREGTELVLLAVTVLTSLDAADLHATGVNDAPGAHALRLARLARSAGVPGLVCSSAEVGPAPAGARARCSAGDAGDPPSGLRRGRPEADRHARRRHPRRLEHPGGRPPHPRRRGPRSRCPGHRGRDRRGAA